MGGTVVGLPHLHAIDTPSLQKPPMRMIFVGTHFGFVPSLFFPKQAGRDYVTPELIQPLEQHRSKFTMISRLDHGREAIGGHGGVHAFLSGILSKNCRGFEEKNVTVDQKAAAHVGTATRFASLQIATGRDQGSALSWNRSGVAMPSISSLSRLFGMLFRAEGPEGRRQVQQAHQEKRSILDLVRTDAKALENQVGREDRETLDQYFTSLRELELRLIQSQTWLDRPKPAVNYTLKTGADALDFVDRVPLYYDLMTLALQTDLTRVMTFSIADLGPNLGGFSISRGYHQLTHHGKVRSYLKELSLIEHFHIKQFSRFLDRLDAIV
ncbi:MAG: DUF1552 domain-containing protein, partial [Verrucomicrobiota bacterium]|nr:DUF1552 domain-containing protein [Verrucomicrobiota bacterium]